MKSTEKSIVPEVIVFKGKLYYIMLSVIVVFILILINAISNKLPWTYDMTKDKLFTLSDYTNNTINKLDNNINVYAFYTEGSENPMIKSLLEEYRKAGKGKIRVEYIDAEKNPIAARKVDIKNEGIANGSVLFEAKGNVKKLNEFDIIQTNSVGTGKSFNGEQQFTGAIKYVTSKKLRKIYFLEGHEEMSKIDQLFKLKSRLEIEGSITQSLNLIKVNTVPADADVILVASPKRDLDVDEKSKLISFLSKGGRAIFLFDVLNASNELTHFNEVLRDYGIAFKNNFVVEEDTNSFYSNNKMYIIPQIINHSVTEKMKNSQINIIMPFASNLELLQDRDSTVKVEELLKSSVKSWVRTKLSDATPTKTKSDRSGPALLAVVITKDNSAEKYKPTVLLVTGNAKFIDDKMVDIQGNFDFFVNGMNFVLDNKEGISIRPKMINNEALSVNGTQFIVILVVSVIILPVLAFGIGLYVWLTRRNL